MKLLVTGAAGMLGHALTTAASWRGHDVHAASRSVLDVTDAGAARRLLDRVRPAAVLHCAAFTQVDAAEAQPDRAFAINAEGAATMARACAVVDARFVYPSTDYVFDGQATRPYRPSDRTAPINVYGHSKLAGEEAARSAPLHLIVRTSWLYGACGRKFVSTMLKGARAGGSLRVVGDQLGSPTWTRDLANTLISLLERDTPSGVYHASNQGKATWYDLACATFEFAGIDATVERVGSAEFPRPAKRPAFSVLDCTTTEAIVGPLRPWRDALQEALAYGVE
ncbi:MAG: dTDP-4-dehydrorhamnose reductase [Gemmatimonadota bacterium]